MGTWKACPVTIRGVWYESITEAAKSIGVSPGTVWRALENGTLDNCGLGYPEKKKVKIEHEGVLYDSMRAVSLSIPYVNYISFASIRGRAERNGQESFIYKGKVFKWKKEL